MFEHFNIFDGLIKHHFQLRADEPAENMMKAVWHVKLKPIETNYQTLLHLFN